MGSPQSTALVKAIQVTIADLEGRFSPEDPSVNKVKAILLQRVEDLEGDEMVKFQDLAASKLRAL